MAQHGAYGLPRDYKRFFPLYVRRLVSSVRARGIVGSAAAAYEEVAFDWSRGTDTGGQFPQPDLDTTGYAGANPVTFREAMAALPVDPSQCTFLDYGSGKGRALLLAAERGFRRVVGVEVSKDLFEISRRNLEKRLGEDPSRFSLHCEDATRFSVPADANVIFFCNPFMDTVFRKVMDRILESKSRHPRTIHLIYVKGTCHHVLDELGIAELEELRGNRHSIYRI
jgi:SAM-dependent methyltransferase